MAPLPNASKVLRVALSGTIDTTQVWLTRFYVQYTGTAPTNTQLVTFATAVNTAYSTDLKSLAPSNSSQTLCDVIDLSSPTSAIGLAATTNAGTRSPGALPDQVCLVTSYEIGRRYRGGHPRGYWKFGVQADTNNSNTWSNTFVSSCTTGINAFFAAVVAATWTGAGTLSQVNLSYYSGFTVVTNPITGRARNVPTLRGTPVVDPVTSVIVRNSFGTQRRREAFVD